MMHVLPKISVPLRIRPVAANIVGGQIQATWHRWRRSRRCNGRMKPTFIVYMPIFTDVEIDHVRFRGKLRTEFFENMELTVA